MLAVENDPSQPARAVWIEIFDLHDFEFMEDGHSLRGLCGLKFLYYASTGGKYLSQPARAVWIEIQISHRNRARKTSHSLRGLCGLKCVDCFACPFRTGVTACEGCVD